MKIKGLEEFLEKSGLFDPKYNQDYLKSGAVRNLYKLLRNSGMSDELIEERIKIFLCRLDCSGNKPRSDGKM